MDTNNREDKLKRLLQAKQKLQEKTTLPTINKEDVQISSIENKMSTIKNTTSTIAERIDRESKSLSNLEQAKQTLEINSRNKAEIVFVFDKSGSCKGTEESVKRGFYDIIEHEKSLYRNDIITTVLFNNKKEIIHDRVHIDNIKYIDYIADGGTALYTTLCTVIDETKARQKQDVIKPEKTIVVIMTDGSDRNSIRYNASDTKKRIIERTKEGWQFIYLGTKDIYSSNYDPLEEAKRIGIKDSNAVEYDPLRLSDNFEAIQKALDDTHELGEVTEEWSLPITKHKTLSSGDEKRYIKKLGDK